MAPPYECMNNIAVNTSQPAVVVAAKLAFFAALMFAFGYAMVPLYEKICEATGINNLLNPAADVGNAVVDNNRLLRAEFVTTASGMVAMHPNMQLAQLTPGKTYNVVYTLKNLTDKTLVGQAVPSYSPARAERWFKKTQCFCFEQLVMAPGEVRQAPVVFVVSADLPQDINTLSLSYTFFEIEGAAAL